MLMTVFHRGGAHIIRSISDSETLHEPHEERTGSHGLRMASPKPETLDIKPDTDTTSGNGGEGPREDGKKTLTLGRPSTTEEVSTAEQPHGEAREDENNHPNTKVSSGLSNIHIPFMPFLPCKKSSRSSFSWLPCKTKQGFGRPFKKLGVHF